MKDARNDIDRQLAELAGLDKATLRRRFAELYGFESDTASHGNLRARVAYRIQENAFGGLSAGTVALLESLADKDPLANLGQAQQRKVSRAKGAKYVREWKGRTYEATSTGDGRFEYGGKVYGSLSAVALAITGTHWNGKRFFGVK